MIFCPCSVVCFQSMSVTFLSSLSHSPKLEDLVSSFPLCDSLPCSDRLSPCCPLACSGGIRNLPKCVQSPYSRPEEWRSDRSLRALRLQAVLCQARIEGSISTLLLSLLLFCYRRHVLVLPATVVSSAVYSRSCRARQATCLLEVAWARA
jgi:hypothetical protein